MEAGAKSHAYPGGHRVRKHQSAADAPRSQTNKERQQVPTQEASSRALHTPTYSLPWDKVVELVRVEDFLDLFFYFGLARMQDMGERK